MNILLSNDDGIMADGLIRLAQIMKAYGNVFVVAPDSQRSAQSHAISLHAPVDVWEAPEFSVEGVRAWKSNGTPADCVRFGIPNILKGNCDLVLTGINHGYNSGYDIQYSATVGAAFEATLANVPAIAVSEGVGGCHDVTDKYLPEILDRLIADPQPKNIIWNVNFPDCSLSDFNGILYNRETADTNPFADTYVEETLPDGGIRMRVVGALNPVYPEGSDFAALHDNCASVGIIRNLHS